MVIERIQIEVLSNASIRSELVCENNACRFHTGRRQHFFVVEYKLHVYTHSIEWREIQHSDTITNVPNDKIFIVLLNIH